MKFVIRRIAVSLSVLLLATPAWATDREEQLAKKHGAVEDGPPPWMTHGEEVRLAVIDDLLKDNAWQDALQVIAKMREDGLDGPEVDLRQGIALRQSGVTSEAEQLLIAAQKKMHGDARPSSELCILYADLQRIDDAIAQCKAATKVDEDDAQAWNNLAFLQLSAGDPQDAEGAAEKAVRLDATEAMYLNNLGMIQAALGHDQEAFRTMSATMSKADAAYMVGLSLERTRGMDEAKPWFDRALQIDPNHGPTHDHLADLAKAESEPGGTPDTPDVSGPAGEPPPGSAPAGSEEP